MKAIILGSTGMIGRSVLLECIADPDVERILLINRKAGNVRHDKIEEIIHDDFFNFSPLMENFVGYDACFFCLGVSSVGMKESEYRRLTYELTLNFARTLASVNPDLVFCFVSGVGTDETENGKVMWARIKGAAENAIRRLPFRDAYMIRPGYIQPLNGVKAKSDLVNLLYIIFKPLYWILRPFPGLVTNSVALARAMLAVARYGYPKKIINVHDINLLAKKFSTTDA